MVHGSWLMAHGSQSRVLVLLFLFPLLLSAVHVGVRSCVGRRAGQRASSSGRSWSHDGPGEEQVRSEGQEEEEEAEEEEEEEEGLVGGGGWCRVVCVFLSLN